MFDDADDIAPLKTRVFAKAVSDGVTAWPQRFDRRSRINLDVIVRRWTVAGGWRRRSLERSKDARTRAQALQNGAGHRRALGSAALTLRWDRERDRDHTGTIEPLVESHQPKIAANGEHAADEEHDGKRNLRDRQRRQSDPARDDTDVPSIFNSSNRFARQANTTSGNVDRIHTRAAKPAVARSAR